MQVLKPFGSMLDRTTYPSKLRKMLSIHLPTYLEQPVIFLLQLLGLALDLLPLDPALLGAAHHAIDARQDLIGLEYCS